MLDYSQGYEDDALFKVKPVERTFAYFGNKEGSPEYYGSARHSRRDPEKVYRPLEDSLYLHDEAREREQIARLIAFVEQEELEEYEDKVIPIDKIRFSGKPIHQKRRRVGRRKPDEIYRHSVVN